MKIGADDYVTKPFSFAELVARVESILRRTTNQTEAIEKYQFNNITLDFKRQQATRNGEFLELSSREYQLLRYFIEHRGEVISREELLAEIWGYKTPLSRTVDMHIVKLRRKIEGSPEEPRHIVTVHRNGYKFCD